MKQESTVANPLGNINYLNGEQRIDNPEIYNQNIEKYVGLAQIPVGLIAPLTVNGQHARGAFSVPMATTEAALVASYDRGAKVINASGGATVKCVSDILSRVPGFIFSNYTEAEQFIEWCSNNLETFKERVVQTTRFGRLQDIHFMAEGNFVYIHFQYTTGDAAGQNMVTIATEAICQYIANSSPIKPRRWYIEANLSGDKKATNIGRYLGRGKHAIAEVIVPAKVVRSMLKTTPAEIVQYCNMMHVGALQSGSIGAHGHFANALAAIFIACGQDVACVAESAVGISRAELTDKGDLYGCISLPNLVVGTVGGGTHLPTQKECLDIMECYGPDKAKKFAEICAAVVLAGEVSIAAAITAGYFTQAHVRYARTKQNES